MPKDSNLLPQHTQELLRAARSGRLYKRPAPADDDDNDADNNANDSKQDKKDGEDDPAEKGFQVKVWKQIARTAEGAAVSHLAKRRKNTVTLSSTLPPAAAVGPMVTKATVRRVDAAGNPYTQTVTLSEGVAVDGEIISTTVVPVPTGAAGAGIETAGAAAATPARRRPPPPKRKSKGPGKGRKKKVQLPLAPGAPGAAGVAGAGVAADGTAMEVRPALARRSSWNMTDITQGIQQAGAEGEAKDSEMADDDDGEDGDEGDEDDEDGDEDGENQEGEDVPVDDDAKPPQPEAIGAEGTTTSLVTSTAAPEPQSLEAGATLNPLQQPTSAEDGAKKEQNPLAEILNTQPLAISELAPSVAQPIQPPTSATRTEISPEVGSAAVPATEAKQEQSEDKEMTDATYPPVQQEPEAPAQPEALHTDAMMLDEESKPFTTSGADAGAIPVSPKQESPEQAAEAEKKTLSLPANVIAEVMVERRALEPVPTPAVAGFPSASSITPEVPSVAEAAAVAAEEIQSEDKAPAETTVVPLEPKAVSPRSIGVEDAAEKSAPATEPQTPDLYSGLEAALGSSGEAAPATAAAASPPPVLPASPAPAPAEEPQSASAADNAAASSKHLEEMEVPSAPPAGEAASREATPTEPLPALPALTEPIVESASAHDEAGSADVASAAAVAVVDDDGAAVAIRSGVASETQVAPAGDDLDVSSSSAVDGGADLASGAGEGPAAAAEGSLEDKSADA